MINFFLIISAILSFGAFCGFLGHVIGFGFRTRKTNLHQRPQSERDELDRRWAGIYVRDTKSNEPAGIAH